MVISYENQADTLEELTSIRIFRWLMKKLERASIKIYLLSMET